MRKYFNIADLAVLNKYYVLSGRMSIGIAHRIHCLIIATMNWHNTVIYIQEKQLNANNNQHASWNINTQKIKQKRSSYTFSDTLLLSLLWLTLQQIAEHSLRQKRSARCLWVIYVIANKELNTRHTTEEIAHSTVNLLDRNYKDSISMSEQF